MTSLRVAVLWPKPRAHRWRLGRSDPDAYPDLSDGLLDLDSHDIAVAIENSCGLWLNPLIGYHEFYSGLDPVRAARVALHVGRYDAAICVGDATAYFLLRLKRLFGLRLPIVLIDPALGDGYARRQALQDFVLPRVDRVVVYGRVQLEYIGARYGKTVRAVFQHHRADTVFYHPPAAGPGREPFVFSIGNDMSRDFKTLAQAAARLHGTSPELSFVTHTTLAVDDEGRDLTIRRHHISYRDLRAAYHRAAVVVVPLANSRHAGGINALLEAMACGAPTVVSGSEGIRDYVEDGVTARVVAVGDADGLAAAIRELMESPTEAAAMATRARQFVVSTCANAHYASGLSAILKQVVSHS